MAPLFYSFTEGRMSLLHCLWVVTSWFPCMHVCVFWKNSASRLSQLNLEPFLKHNKHPPALSSNTNALTLLSRFFSSFTKIQDPHRKESHCFCSWLKVRGNVAWISFQGVCFFGRDWTTLATTCRGSSDVWVSKERIWQRDEEGQWIRRGTSKPLQ